MRIVVLIDLSLDCDVVHLELLENDRPELDRVETLRIDTLTHNNFRFDGFFAVSVVDYWDGDLVCAVREHLDVDASVVLEELLVVQDNTLDDPACPVYNDVEPCAFVLDVWFELC